MLRTVSPPALAAFAFPVLAVVAPRGITSLLAAVGLYGAALAAGRRAWRELFPPWFAGLMAVFLAWSLYASLAPATGAPGFGLWPRLALLALCGFAAIWRFRFLSAGERRRVHDALIAGIVASLLLLWLAQALPWPSPATPVGDDRARLLAGLDRGQAVIAIAVWPAAGVLLLRRRRVAACLLVSATLVTFASLPSGIAVAALGLGVAGMAWGLTLRRPATRLLAGALVACILAAPFAAAPLIGAALEGRGPSATAAGVETSAVQRLEVWAEVVRRAGDRPFAGWGLDAGRSAAQSGGAAGRDAAPPPHPHNAVLQVWLELGVPGLVLLAAVVGYAATAGLAGAATRESFAVRSAAVLAAVTSAALAFGMWQTWWFSALLLTAALVAALPPVPAARTAGGRIRVLVNGLHSRSGGGLTYLRNVVPLLAREPDLEVHLCIREDQPDVWSEGPAPVAVHRLAAERGVWRLPLREQFTVPALADRIGAQVTFSPANYGPVLAPGPVILIGTVLGVGLVDRRPRMIAYWVLLYLATAASLLASRAAIVISDYAWKSVARAGLWAFGKRVTVIPHGVGAVFSPPAAAAERADFLLAVSDIYVQKNYENLVAALARLRPGHPALSLKIAGRPVDADCAERLRRRIGELGLGDQIELLGQVGTDALAELYRRCAVFVFPSRVESFGIPLVEAMASGAPIASSRAAAMPEVLGDAALFFDPDDVDDMAATIARLVDEPELRRRLAAKAVARARDFSWERTAARTAEVIRRAAGEATGVSSCTAATGVIDVRLPDD